MTPRIGQGYDVHKLAPGYDLWIGGIKIDHNVGSVGHSDGDVLIHAVCDALLGAASLRDIGYHFPDTDPSLKGIDSKIILRQTVQLVRDAGFEVGNIDSTVCLQEPKLKDYIPLMQKVMADEMNITPNSVSVKATTTERLGFVGRTEGVEAHAIALIYKQE